MKCFFMILFLSGQIVYSQVGINTNNPLQALHIAGSTGTLRIESLNHSNNLYNGGDIDNDGDLSNNTFPLYVDENGDFTLKLKIPINSEETDAFDDTNLPTSSVSLPANDSDGVVTTNIKTYTITTTRASLLEVRYNLSYEIYLNNTHTPITDNLARRVQTHIKVSGRSRVYGAAAKCYSSGTSKSVNAIFYNSSSTYIRLPSAGSYDITFVGAVSSNVKSGGGGSTSQATFVEFATDNDFVFMRIH